MGGFGQPSTDLVQVLREYYANLLQPFEPRWASVVQQRIQAAMRQQQGIGMANGISLNGANVGSIQAMVNPSSQMVPPTGGLSDQHIQGAGGSFQQMPPQGSHNQMHSILPTALVPLSDGISSQSHTLGLPGTPQRTTGPIQSNQMSLSSSSDFLPTPDLSSDGARPPFTQSANLLGTGVLQEDLPGGLPHDELELRKRKRSDYSEVEGKRTKLDEDDANLTVS